MSENLRKRLLGSASTDFIPETVLKAADLNMAFEKLRWEAALRAAAPRAPGLFRPWWCDEDETVNRIALSESRRHAEISPLFLMTRAGRLVHVPATKKVPLNKGQRLYLTSDGEAAAGPDVPEGAISLARKRDGSTLMIEAEIATIDATREIAALHRKTLEIAADWTEALLAQPTGDGRLPSVFASIPQAGAGAVSALDRLAHAADSVDRHLARRDPRDPRLRTLTTPPATLAVSTVAVWLDAWSKVLGDRTLRALVLSEADWLSPDFRALGTDLDGMREHHFDISHLGEAKLELHASSALERARWRFGERGERHIFTKPHRVQGGGWRASLPPATAGILFVWTKSETVRLRAIKNPGAAR